MPYALHSLIDSSILIGLLVPLYFGFYRPYWQEHLRIEGENRTLSHQLLRNVEEERKRVSHDLHDQCGQTLTSIRFGIDVLSRSLTEDQGLQKQQIHSIQEMVGKLGDELREIVYQLRPPMLDRFGLVAAMKDLVSEISRLHPELSIEGHYDYGSEEEKLSPEEEVALYRVCQESLHNILKYASASKVSVILERQGAAVQLTVQDNGVGFEKERSANKTNKRQGVGIFGMRERINALNGTFDVCSESGEGTKVKALIPTGS